MKPFYASPLARIHDLFYGDLARAAAEFLAGKLAGEGDTRRILDLGCGSGILAARLAEQGYEVTGIDISASMIDIARLRAPTSSFRVASIYDIELPCCDVVCAIGEVLNYVADGPHPPDVLPSLFQRIRHCLSPSGIFLLDIVTHDLPADPATRTIGLDAETIIGVTALRDPGAQIVKRHIQLWESNPSRPGAPYVEVHRQHLFHPEAISGLLRSSGFAPVRISGYGDRPFRPGVTGFYCQRD